MLWAGPCLRKGCWMKTAPDSSLPGLSPSSAGHRQALRHLHQPCHLAQPLEPPQEEGRRDGDPCGWCVGWDQGQGHAQGPSRCLRLWAPRTWLGAADSGTPGGHCTGGLDKSGRGREEARGGEEASGHLDCLRPAPGPSANHRGSGWEAPAALASPRLCLSYWRLSQSPSLSIAFSRHVSLSVCSLLFLYLLSAFSLPLQLSRLFSCTLRPSFPSAILFHQSAAPSLPSLRFPTVPSLLSCQIYMLLKRKKEKKKSKSS